MERVNKIKCEMTGLGEEYIKKNTAFQTLLSACQLLCDTSDKMLPKMERNTPIAENVYNNGEVKGYNQAREEDILWLTKKLMGIEEVIKKEEITFYPRRQEKDGKTYYTVSNDGAKKLANAIIQSFGQEKGRE